MNLIEQNYQRVLTGDRSVDICEHLPVLRRYAEKCDHITELGVRWIVSTWAFLAANPKEMVSVDIEYPDRNIINASELTTLAIQAGIDFKFIKSDDLEIELEETDLLFIDTLHTYEQLCQELFLHGNKARKYIILHDTYTFGLTGQDGQKGLLPAIAGFLRDNPQWMVIEDLKNNNGLMILGRVNQQIVLHESVYTKKEIIKSVSTDKKIKFIVPFIDRPYYLWQILVQINNFRKMGYEQDTIFLGTTFADMVTPELQKMVDSPDVKAKFVLYPEDRLIRRYPASLKPRTMAKYFRDFPEEKDTVYVYLDPDVIFLRPIDFSVYANDDIWYEGDTTGYLNSRYIKSKGEQLFLEMCMIVGIDPQVVMANDLNCGGAQFIIKNNTYELWHEIEILSVILYKHMDETKEKYCPPGQQYPIQAWAAEMWTTNWCLWKYGIETRVIPEMNFHMADHALSRLEHPFLHCTGTVIPGIAFNKLTYQDSPFKIELPDYPDSITSLYVKEIREVKINFPDLIW